MSKGRLWAACWAPASRASRTQPPAIVGIGNVVRNNHLRDNNVTGSMEGRAHPFKLAAPAKEIGYDCRDTLIEGNTIADTPVALDVYPFHLDTLLRSNRVERAVRPLRDDGINTWIHPAERLGYQIQAIKWLLGERVNLGDIERDAGRLSGEPATAPELAERCARVREQLWAAVARCQPQGTTPEIAAVLVGLRYELAPIAIVGFGQSRQIRNRDLCPHRNLVAGNRREMRVAARAGLADQQRRRQACPAVHGREFQIARDRAGRK